MSERSESKGTRYRASISVLKNFYIVIKIWINKQSIHTIRCHKSMMMKQLIFGSGFLEHFLINLLSYLEIKYLMLGADQAEMVGRSHPW